MIDDQKIISSMAKEIVDRGMVVTAIFFFESTKYISFIGSQLLVFLGPIATCFINNNQYYNYVKIIEKRSNIDFLLNEIERINCNS